MPSSGSCADSVFGVDHLHRLRRSMLENLRCEYPLESNKGRRVKRTPLAELVRATPCVSVPPPDPPLMPWVPSSFLSGKGQGEGAHALVPAAHPWLAKTKRRDAGQSASSWPRRVCTRQPTNNAPAAFFWRRCIRIHLGPVVLSITLAFRRWGSNPSGKCSPERLTRGTVTSTIRRAANPSGCARCGAGAGCSAIKYQSLTSARRDFRRIFRMPEQI